MKRSYHPFRVHPGVVASVFAAVLLSLVGSTPPKGLVPSASAQGRGGNINRVPAPSPSRPRRAKTPPKIRTARRAQRKTPEKPPRDATPEYGTIVLKDDKWRLDNFAVELRGSPEARGYIICYGGRKVVVGEANKRCADARQQLTARGIADSRLVTVEGGHREKPEMELWIVPEGASPPHATPTVFPGGAHHANNSNRGDHKQDEE
jgi:hypothetical protein